MSQVHAEGGNAEVHDRTGLLVSIVALVTATAALVVAVMGYVSNRDRIIDRTDDIIKLEGESQQLKIQLDELKK